MPLSAPFAASLALLLIAAIAYFSAIGTKSWSFSGNDFNIGLWEHCTHDRETKVEFCYPNVVDFCMAAQAFSILAVMCYAVTFLIFLAYLVLPTLSKSRPVTMAVCLLTFCIVSLQIMTMIVYGVKVREFFNQLERKYFTYQLQPLSVSWSFAFAIISTILVTVTGICTFIELRNITMEEFI